MKDNQSTNFSALAVFQFIWRWRKVFIIVFLVSGFLSFGLSYLIPKKYKSVVVMVPAESNGISRMSVHAESTLKDLQDYGEEEQCEYLTEALNSTDLARKVIAKMNLADHYFIKKNSPYRDDLVLEKYLENVQVKSTDNLAVKVTVEDRDPKMAANIANYISEQVNVLRKEMKDERSKKALEITQMAKDSLLVEIAQVEEDMKSINQKGVVCYEEMVERIYQQLAIAIANGNQAAAKRLRDEINSFSPYIAHYLTLREYMKNKSERLSDIDNRLMELKADAASSLPAQFVVQKAEIAQRKDSPKRISFTFIVTLSALILSAFVLVFVERGKGWMNKIENNN